MDLPEILLLTGSAVAACALFILGVLAGMLLSNRAADRAYEEQAAPPAGPPPGYPVTSPGRRTTRFVDPDPTREVIIMGKHSRGNAPGTAAQQQADKKAAEQAELAKLEAKLRKAGKIK